ncbi:hypothetical protein LTR53_008918 [Teratosphaeriaceae sp. CCFEE 6253]|nr:hypothetical protein LTR53_008918 [Teratosphaeriaceae sp. CCFEE 6253]
MSLPATQQQPAASATTERKPRALADIQLNNILADHGTSSEDEPPDAQDIPAEDARTAVGISISRQQTRLNSPLTPAAEKAAALAEAGGYFGGSMVHRSPYRKRERQEMRTEGLMQAMGQSLSAGQQSASTRRNRTRS